MKRSFNSRHEVSNHSKEQIMILSKTRNFNLHLFSITYAPCEPRLMRGGATHPASAHQSARGAICAAVLASELADTDGLDYRKESAMKKKAEATKAKNTIRHSIIPSIFPSIFPLFFLTVGLWFYRTFEPLVDCVIFLFLVLANRGVCVHIDYKQEDYYKTRCFL